MAQLFKSGLMFGGACIASFFLGAFVRSETRDELKKKAIEKDISNLDELKKQMDESISSLSSQIKDLKNTKLDLSSEITELRETYDNWKEKLDPALEGKLRSKIIDLEKQKEQLEDDMETYLSDNNDLNDKVDSLNDEIIRLKAEKYDESHKRGIYTYTYKTDLNERKVFCFDLYGGGLEPVNVSDVKRIVSRVYYYEVELKDGSKIKITDASCKMFKKLYFDTDLL